MMCSLSLRKASVGSRCSGVPLPPRGSASPGRGPWAVEGVRGGAMGFHREAPPSPAGGAPNPPGFLSLPSRGCKTAPPEAPFHPRGDL